ncbi:MAG: amino acid adenylation domain-containing protein [Beijerinckiaceae bacterium]|nr:amino acid adenylation domain-containing protein [Beijerinckiaceae bacterium]
MTQTDPELLTSAAETPPEAAPAMLRGAQRPDLLRDELLAEIFAATVAASPDAICHIVDGVSHSYADVDRDAVELARGLLRHGVKPGDVIGLWMPRGGELLVAQIAIAKTGAAWLPFDADAPPERIAVCLEDASAKALLAAPAKVGDVEQDMPCRVLTPAALRDPSDHSLVDARAMGARPDQPAYLIYTSGSTGTPKGIVVTGANICHYLRSANEVYGLVASDVVFQGASVAFDLSMEEIWVPYLVGASLFVATPKIMGETDNLPEVMDKAGVTVLDTVPTLLAMLPRDVASLRVIILGGEACPPTVASRWCRPGRTIFNSYGPTEATVVATVAEVRPGEPVTIGGPIPNYTCYVADDALNLLGRGIEGELLIGGPGVARGYLNRSLLTAEKFIQNPYGTDGVDPILYRSGDAVAMDAAGNILFRGRIDDQVKIRGFRVELGEIETKLTEIPGIAHAAVVLRTDDGMDQLVAFLVADKQAETDFDPRRLRALLRDRLPAYMVPGRYETLDELPRLSSGKVNRNQLKRAELTTPAGTAEEQEEPRTPTEARLLEAAKAVLPPQAIPFDADFFTDLGGHSLLAARFVSIVRQTHGLAGITLQDVYATRSLRAMGEMLDTKFAHVPEAEDLSFEPPPWRRRFLCGLAQGIVMPFILALMTAQWLGVFVSYMLLTSAEAGLLTEIFSLLGVYVCINLATVAIVIVGKWALIGRTKPGRYPLWGSYYFRWWLVQRLIGLMHLKWFQGSPVMRILLRALGAKVGDDAIIGEIESGALDLVEFGRYSCIGGKVELGNARVVGNELIIDRIIIGEDAYIGNSCIIEGNTIIGEGAELRDLTSLQDGSRIGPFEIWDGSPGKKVGVLDPAELDEFPVVGKAHRALQTFCYTIALLAIPPIGLLPIFPAFWVFDYVDEWIGVADLDRTLYMASIPILAWPTAFAMVLITVGFIVLIRWAVLPRVREGSYSVHSWFYFRKWVVALSTEITLETLSSLFATIYMRAWYRLMGAKIGKGAEISTNLAGRYDLVEIGAKNFIADEVVLGDEEVRRGWMHLKMVKTGAHVFVGNDAVVPAGSEIPSGALIGIKSKPPANELMSENDTWFGSPPIKLPVRQKFDALGANWTYEPPFWKKAARAVFEAVHISLPTMLFITFGTWAVEVFGPALLAGQWLKLFLLFVAASVTISVGILLVVVMIKWLVMGRYEPVVKPMWSWWAMRTESVAVLYWGLAGKVLLEHLRGTPFLPWTLRLFGTHIGKGVYMNMTDITEFDCVTIGDFVALNGLSALQTHLYEDRVMKVGRVFVADGVTVGAGSTVLYDTHVGQWARLGPLTIVMKGEHIPANTEWIGAPAEPAMARIVGQAQA